MKKREFTAEYKAKIVLETLTEENQLGRIAIRENLNRTQLQNWKKEFIENGYRIFDEKKIEETAQRKSQEARAKEADLIKEVDKLTVQRDWLKRNLSEHLAKKGNKNLVSKDEKLSVKRQCELLGTNRTSVYYKPKEVSPKRKAREELIKARLDFWHTQQCYLGVRRLKERLEQEDNLIVGRKFISQYMHEMGICVVYEKQNFELL